MAKQTIIITLFLVIIFSFLRLYSLSNSLFFINDGGRDLDVLYTWKQTGKIPLLGPQTSVFPINQGAIYFYILYPIYYLTNGSYLSPTFTAVTIYIITFILCLWIIFKYQQPRLIKISIITFYLVSLHPLFIDQTRQVWNPTLVTPFVLTSLLLFYMFSQKQSSRLMFLASVFLSLAITLSYSVAPLLIAIIIYGFIFFRKYLFRFLLFITISLLFFNLPTIIFELRHHFLLTSSIFTKTALSQTQTQLPQKYNSLSYCVISSGNNNLNLIIFSIFIITNIVLLFKHKNQMAFFNLALFTQILVLPVNTECHYLYPLISLFFISLSLLPSIVLLPLILYLSFNYLQPQRLGHYFITAPRTYSQLDNCFYQYCQTQKQDLQVSVVSGYYPWHYGPEFRYFLKKNNCQISDASQTILMSVINDNSKFDQTTNYPELENFGKFKINSEFQCLPNFKITTIQKI